MLQSLYRPILQGVRDRLALHRAGHPDWVVYFGGEGFGDDLLLTAVLHELRRRDSGRLAVITRLTGLFAHSPDVDVVLDNDWPVLEAQLRRGRRGVHPLYYRPSSVPDVDGAPPWHIIAEMCHQIGLAGDVHLRPHLYLQPSELTPFQRASCGRPRVAIQSMSHGSLNAAPNKVWTPGRYQEVVDRNRHRFDFVQLGTTHDAPLQGAEDLRGRTTPRESAAMLAACDAAICYTGFLMHLCRAAGTRAVVIFGGREHPDISGYSCNENLFTALPCSPCWRRQTCIADHACMSAITVTDVTAALERVLDRRPMPLETATVTLP
jgi:hypothetical protein